MRAAASSQASHRWAVAWMDHSLAAGVPAQEERPDVDRLFCWWLLDEHAGRALKRQQGERGAASTLTHLFGSLLCRGVDKRDVP